MTVTDAMEEIRVWQHEAKETASNLHNFLFYLSEEGRAEYEVTRPSFNSLVINDLVTLFYQANAHNYYLQSRSSKGLFNTRSCSEAAQLVKGYLKGLEMAKRCSLVGVVGRNLIVWKNIGPLFIAIGLGPIDVDAPRNIGILITTGIPAIELRPGIIGS